VGVDKDGLDKGGVKKGREGRERGRGCGVVEVEVW